jgi:hypothetical protein
VHRAIVGEILESGEMEWKKGKGNLGVESSDLSFCCVLKRDAEICAGKLDFVSCSLMKMGWLDI